MSFRQVTLCYCVLLLLLINLHHGILERIKFISLERPVVSYCNKKFIPYMNMTARRYNRGDPIYYFNAYFDFLIPINDNITVNFYFLDFVSSGNTYKKTYFDLHFKCCDLLNNDKFIGNLYRQGTMNKCPLPSGVHNVINSTISAESALSVMFPFKKGRMMVNCTYYTGEIIAYGYIDVEFKDKVVRAKKNK